MTFSLIPKKETVPEILDLPAQAYRLEELQGSFADLRAVNRYLGDRRALLKHLATRVGERPAFSLLDVATGSADLPIAVAQWARQSGIRAAITGVDINEQTVRIAREQAAGYPEIELRVADGLSLPFPDKSFDFVLCSKTAHHLSERDNIRLIREMMRVAARGFLLMDLRRSWIAYALIYLLTRLFTRNRVTRHDGPLSVLKAFTPAELAAVVSNAGASQFTISKEPFWLMVLSGEVVGINPPPAPHIQEGGSDKAEGERGNAHFMGAMILNLMSCIQRMTPFEQIRRRKMSARFIC